MFSKSLNRERISAVTCVRLCSIPATACFASEEICCTGSVTAAFSYDGNQCYNINGNTVNFTNSSVNDKFIGNSNFFVLNFLSYYKYVNLFFRD